MISLLINKHTPADTQADPPPLGRGEYFAPAFSRCHSQSRHWVTKNHFAEFTRDSSPDFVGIRITKIITHLAKHLVSHM